MPLVFQYGSNCSAQRLNSPQRLNGAAKVEGRAQTVNEYEIAFDIWSRVNQCAAADLIPAHGSGRHAWGVLYRISEEGLRRLREIEGVPYEERIIRVRNLAGEIKEAITFLVKAGERRLGLWTSANYVGYIVAGLREQEVAEEYTRYVIDVAVRTNEEAEDRDTAETQLPSLEALRAL